MPILTTNANASAGSSGILTRLREFFARFRIGSGATGDRARFMKRLHSAAAAGRMKQQLRAELPYRIRAGRVRVRIPGVRIPPETVDIRPRLNGSDNDSTFLS